MAKSLNYLIHNIKLWHKRTFTKATLQGQVNKLREELEEFEKNPSADEWADVMVCVIGIGRIQGYDFNAALEAVYEKNLARDWPTEPAEDGTFQHIEPAAEVAPVPED